MEQFQEKVNELFAKHETLLSRKNIPLEDGNGIFTRYQHPVLTAAHTPIFWRYDLNEKTNPYLMERIGMTLDDAAFATSLYFIFRTAGCFLGSFILRQMSPKSFFGISVVMMLAAMVGLFIFHDKAVIYTCIALIGFGNSNVFSVIFSQALLYLPGKKNEVSGLMIMGLFGGTVFPLAMGVASDTSMGQNGAIAVMTVGVLYLLFYTFRIKK